MTEETGPKVGRKWPAQLEVELLKLELGKLTSSQWATAICVPAAALGHEAAPHAQCLSDSGQCQSQSKVPLGPEAEPRAWPRGAWPWAERIQLYSCTAPSSV